MAVIHQQLLPSPITPPRAQIFVDCLKMLKIHCGINASHPGSGGLLFAQEKDFKMSTVLPAGFENRLFVCFFKGKFSFGNHKPDVTFLLQQNKLLNYYSKDPLCCSKDVLDWC